MCSRNINVIYIFSEDIKINMWLINGWLEIK